MTPPPLLWIATAPPGVPSTGPHAVYEVQHKLKYEQMGWTVEGPYYHIDQMLPSCVACPECGAEVDTRTAEPL